MRTLRARLAAIGLIAGIVAATGGSMFAHDRHPICAAKQHDCEKPTKISNCCCGDQSAVQNEATPARSRVEVQTVQFAHVLPNIAHLVPIPQPQTAVHTSSPWLRSLDLPTLFASLLI